MRKLTVALLIFIAGWGLGWLTHQFPAPGSPRPARHPVTAAPSGPTPESPASIAGPAMPVPADDLAQRLRRNEFDAVMERYEALRHQVDETSLARARGQILAHAGRLIEERRYALAESLLQRFLDADYRNVQARLLLAESLEAQQDLRAAIDQLYEARGHAWRPEMVQRISGRIRALVAGLAQSLQRNDDPHALLALYRYLVQQEPDYAPWFIELAAVQQALGDAPAARETLRLVAQDPDVGAQARTMLAGLSVAFADVPEEPAAEPAPAVAGIPLQRSGRHFLVEARPAGGRSVHLLLDTGASLTILTPEVLEGRGIRYRDTGRRAMFSTANGQVEGPIYRLDALAVGDWRVEQLEIGVLALDRHTGVDGLLGMNFLGSFRFFIDQNAAELRLAGN